MTRFLLGMVVLGTLAGCAETTDGVVARAPNAGEQACLLGVTRQTNNPDVVLLGSSRIDAGRLVRIGVGPDRAPWQCVAYDDGRTGDIASITDEGVL
ncbi:MAG: hypothetical protein NXH97_04420 [Rhodobacteraceae bacterium]|nr:hypothetical protein [Paracoccaceae bacterium]